MKRSIQLAFALLIFSTSFGQDKWDIRRCVDHALKNNISVRQTDLQSRFSELSYKQNKGGQLPSLNFGSSVGYRLGRSDNPTTGVLEDNNFLNVGMQLQSSVSLFNWFSQKNTIEASRLSWEADKEQTKNSERYCFKCSRCLLTDITGKRAGKLDKCAGGANKSTIRKYKKEGRCGSVARVKCSRAGSTIGKRQFKSCNSRSICTTVLLQMKALLNLDAGASFDIVTPPVSLIPLEALADLQPDAVYGITISTLPQQKLTS